MQGGTPTRTADRRHRHATAAPYQCVPREDFPTKMAVAGRLAIARRQQIKLADNAINAEVKMTVDQLRVSWCADRREVPKVLMATETGRERPMAQAS